MESLRKLGYTNLSIPAEDLKPLSLLLKTSRGVVENLNESIDQLWQPINLAVPVIKTNAEMPGLVSAEDTLDMKAETSFNFLKALTRILPSGLNASFSYDKDKKVKFKLENPKKDYVSIIKLDAFIQDAKLETSAKSIIERLQDGDLYVVTEIIKTNSFSIERDNASGTGGKVNAPVTEVVEAKVEVGVNTSKNTMVEYKGDNFLTFGFKAYKIFCIGSIEEGNFSFRIREAENIIVYRGEEEYPAFRLPEGTVDLQPRTVSHEPAGS